ncbi:hypothetical protein IWZ03DRAFT_241996 [Phyllosticta citriasiana]|uniref:Secreted protein n=1 Tax=Phyllosticta citriasiana TaxID=595635 RepID=A0ABR1KFJ7_9PEZI
MGATTALAGIVAAGSSARLSPPQLLAGRSRGQGWITGRLAIFFLLAVRLQKHTWQLAKIEMNKGRGDGASNCDGPRFCSRRATHLTAASWLKISIPKTTHVSSTAREAPGNGRFKTCRALGGSRNLPGFSRAVQLPRRPELEPEKAERTKRETWPRHDKCQGATEHGGGWHP